MKPQTYVIDGGDGDQTYFSAPIYLTDTKADWFSGAVLRGEGRLMRAVKGKHAGKYFVLSPRGNESIEAQFARNSVASVIVHIVNNPTPSFDGGEKDATAFGMAVLQYSKRRRWF